MRPHRWLPHPWDSPGKNTGVGCHLLLQSMKVKSESDVAQPCQSLRDLMDCSLPGSSVPGSFQARVLEWVPLPSPLALGLIISLIILHFLFFISWPLNILFSFPGIPVSNHLCLNLENTHSSVSVWKIPPLENNHLPLNYLVYSSPLPVYSNVSPGDCQTEAVLFSVNSISGAYCRVGTGLTEYIILRQRV